MSEHYEMPEKSGNTPSSGPTPGASHGEPIINPLTVPGRDNPHAAAIEESPESRVAPRRARATPEHRASTRRDILDQAINVIATAVAVLATVITTTLAIHIVFVVFRANTSNSIVSWVNTWGTTLSWKFHDMFTPKDQRGATLVNEGLAGIIYLIAGRIAAGLIRRFARRPPTN